MQEGDQPGQTLELSPHPLTPPLLSPEQLEIHLLIRELRSSWDSSHSQIQILEAQDACRFLETSPDQFR